MRDVLEIDAELVEQAHRLRQRAQSLRSQATSLPDVLGSAYRRRASELEFESWVSELQAGLPYDQVHSGA
jgi:CHAD domain-containing protein